MRVPICQAGRTPVASSTGRRWRTRPALPTPLPRNTDVASHPPPEVRADALAKAAAARRARALVKGDLKKGRTDLPAIIARAETDDVGARIKVIDILASLPGFAKIRAKNVMEELDIAESRRLRGWARTSAPHCSNDSSRRRTGHRPAGTCTSG
ncbi:hypothetical protein GCM10027068_13440 [Prescottella soli]|uniref:integration host factor, actinobacterial type n=1 Tax=Prescottella soli TaxID=1543852 RepID=UPI0038B77207